MKEKDTTRDDKRSSAMPVAVFVVVVVVLLPMLYVLSIGPAMWAVRPDEEIPAWLVIYDPLIWLANQSQLLHKTLTWYLDLWG